MVIKAIFYHMADIGRGQGTMQINGLSSEEAFRRLKTEGHNELPSARDRTIISTAYEVMKEPMFLLLIAAGTVYFFIGDTREAIILLVFVLFVIGITIYQERKVERALNALKDMSSPRALVIRDGRARMIPGRDVVRGDIIVIKEGDRVSADARVLSCSNLSVDESLLTGEPVPVHKTAFEGIELPVRPGGDGLPYVYSSTLVVQGHGIVEAIAIGQQTEIGRIGRSLKTAEPGVSPLKKEMNWLVKIAAISGISVCAIVIILYGATRGNWLNGILLGITLAMALIPEEIPVVLTIFLALGAWRISRRRVLTRRPQAIQALGSITVLCVDKTGTITQNIMSVYKLYVEGPPITINEYVNGLQEPYHELLEYAILASQRDPFDTMDRAIKSSGEAILAHSEHMHDQWSLEREYPLTKQLMAVTHVWKEPGSQKNVIATKGAPETICDLCHLDKTTRKRVLDAATGMADEGLRVLGVARACYKGTGLPENQHDFDFQYLGLIGLYDPVRAEVPRSMEECREAGIRVIMITGDYPATARNIAKQAGISPSYEVITGIDLDGMSDEELKRRIENVNVFARILPEQKLRIVNMLKRSGYVVLMTGDGVNDAPALKSANVGIAMGNRGTEVAREAASFVLLDDDFSSIVLAVKTGRRILDNIKKAVSYIFAIHVPIAGISLLPILLGWPILLYPAHIAFLQLIIDPVCAIVFEAEPEEKDIMKKPPKRMGEPVLSGGAIALSVLQGLVILAAVAGMFHLSQSFGYNEERARALVFTTLVFANLGLIMTDRSWNKNIVQILKTPNQSLIWVFIGALLLLIIVLYVPFISPIFLFGRLSIEDLILCMAAGAVSTFWFETYKATKKG